jgi:hypothetical protein
VGTFALLALVIWRVSRVEIEGVHATNSAQQQFEDAHANADTAHSGADLVVWLSNTALATSITLPYIQFTGLALQLPFGMPSVLAKTTVWIGALFSFDFGQIASPECTISGHWPETILLTNFAATHGLFLGLCALLAIVGCYTNDRAHAVNATMVLYTPALDTLVHSCAQSLACSARGSSSLEVMPDIECWTEKDFKMAAPAIAMFVVIIVVYMYVFVVPIVLLCRVKGAGQRQLSDPAFLKAHAWILLKYAPHRWHFEFVLLVYKIFWICTSVMMNSDLLAPGLLVARVATTVGLLVLVATPKPFVEDGAIDGGALGDVNKLEAIVLVALRATYAVASVCMVTGTVCSSDAGTIGIIAFEAALMLGVLYLGFALARKQDAVQTSEANVVKSPTNAVVMAKTRPSDEQPGALTDVATPCCCDSK